MYEGTGWMFVARGDAGISALLRQLAWLSRWSDAILPLGGWCRQCLDGQMALEQHTAIETQSVIRLLHSCTQQVMRGFPAAPEHAILG